MRTKSLIAVLLSLCLLVSCTKFDYDKLRSRDGIMMYIGSTSYELMYQDSNNCTGIGYEIDWDGNITRYVGYQITETLYYYADLSEKDYKTLYEFAEHSRKTDPFKNYSERVYDGWVWDFEYYFDEGKDPFTIYHGYCYQQKELQKILDLLESYFPGIEYIPAPTVESDNTEDQDNTSETIEETVIDQLTPLGYVSVDQFKSYYGLDGINDDSYIEDFILFQQITEEQMFEYDYGKELTDSIANGDYSLFGYNMNWNVLNYQEIEIESRDAIAEATGNARWIYMVFEVPIPDSDETQRVTMLSDLYHDKYYYDVDENNYRNSRKRTNLTELAREIQVEMIPEDAERQNPDRDKYALSYEYDVYIFSYDREYIHISNDSTYRFHQSFDIYWKLVYYRIFCTEFEVSSSGT